MSAKRILIGVVVLVLVVGGVLARRHFAGSKGPEFKEVAVKRSDLAVTILSTGVVKPENRVEIKPPINGRVEKVLVKEGTQVRKGQVLALMSSTERAALIDAARAKGKDELKQWEEMYKSTPILAPISGTIIQRNVESGQSFTSADAVLVMSDRLTVKAQVDETDIARIKLKQDATIVLDAYSDQEIPGLVDEIAYDAQTVNNVTTYVVNVLPTKTPDFMRSGMTANVTFRIDYRKDVVAVPVEAVRKRGGESTVKVREGGQVVERKIATGISDGKLIEVTEGLSDQEVVLTPEFKLEGKKRGGNPLTPGGGGRRGH